MSRYGRSLNIFYGLLPSLLAFSIPIAQAGPGDVNSINTGSTVQAGTYFNTPGSRTTFQNNSSLLVRGGDVVRGLESNTSATPTGNGGTLYFRAPVVRLDGTVDVSAVRNGSLYTGNGGKVFVDSNYLFQSGNIFANGANGGLVQLNVGSMTMTNGAKITAQGFGGDGGSLNINSPGVVDIQSGALLDSSGKVFGTFDTNVINIEGGLVNNQGLLRANGLAGTDLKPDNGDAQVMANNPNLANNPVPGPISPGGGTHDVATMRSILFETPGSADFRGGTVRLVASGQTQNNNSDVNNSSLFSATEKSTITGRISQLIQSNNGDVAQQGNIEANGALNKNGGTVMISAARNVLQSGSVQANGGTPPVGVFDSNGNGANGGNGGAVLLAALGSVNQSGTVQTNGGNGGAASTVNLITGTSKDAVVNVTETAGAGGRGGVIALSAPNMSNSGSLQANGGVGGMGGHANTFDIEVASTGTSTARATSTGGAGGLGGHGGMVLFSGNNNPSGNGSISANGGQGGRGGNAWADTKALSTTGTPVAVSVANSGPGGNGGVAGTIVTVNPGTLASTQTFSTKAGGSGNSGIESFREVSVLNNVTQSTNTGSTPSTPGTVVTGNNTPVLATRRNEFIQHEENGFLLSQAGGAGNLVTTLSGRLNDATIRTVTNPTGTSGANSTALNQAELVANLVVSSNAALNLQNDLVNTNINPLFVNLNTHTILNNGNIDNRTFWTPGVHVIGEGFHDISFSLGGGHISWLAQGNITNNQITITRGLWGGGSIHAAATQDVVNNSDFMTIGPNKALLSGFQISGPLYESSHSGSLIFKGGRDVINASNGKIESHQIFFDIHPALAQNPPIAWPTFLNGAQIGSKIVLLANRNLVNNGLLQANTLTYRNGAQGAANPALTIGGTIIGRHTTGTFTNTGTLTAQGQAFFSPNEADGPRFTQNTFPATTSFNGSIDIP